MKYEQIRNLLDEPFRRFYRMTKRSATEWDVCQKLQLLDEQKYIKGRELIIRIVSILVKMAQRKN